MRKFTNAIKVQCMDCRLVYWTEAGGSGYCCSCRGAIQEAMEPSDYAWKRQLEAVK